MRVRHPFIAVLMAASAGLAVAVPSTAIASGHAAAPTPRSGAHTTAPRDDKGYYDARIGTRGQQLSRSESTLKHGTATDLTNLTKAVGSDAQVSFDPATGTPSNVASAKGYLTGASRKSPVAISIAYVVTHLNDFGLTPADLKTFKLRKTYVDPLGTTHLYWEQLADGVPVFGNGLRTHVDKHGRLIAVQGSPVSGLTAKASAATTSPDLSATAARSDAVKDVGGVKAAATAKGGSGDTRRTTWTNGDTASLVWFVSGSGVRLGWNTYTQGGGDKIYTHVVDAGTGHVLYRSHLVDSDNPPAGDGQAYVYDYYPGAQRGGTPKAVNFYRKGWLTRGAGWLSGEAADVYADTDDDNVAEDSEKAPVPTLKTTRLSPFSAATNPWCATNVCTWDADTPYSWQKNETADSANAFYLASTYHDYLEGKPFGFTPKAGNFEAKDGDEVQLQTLDGADTATDDDGNPLGLPDADHIDNANMATPPDGTAPTMQMYLWHMPGATNEQDPYVPTSGAFDASILLHEYTHGLSNRLVVDATGNSTLNSIQAGSMGEAWSDYYAMDYLVTKGFQKDTSKDGEVLEGRYVAGEQLFRTEAIDCTVGATSTNCPEGGYTYGDFPTIGGAPEVHASGEVWAQTLWDIRKAFGHTVADTLITRAMELSPDDPTMLDERNAILQADKVGYDGRHTRALWTLFAKRGMGYYAGAIDGGDTQPAEDFHAQPVSSRLTTLRGTVKDTNTGAPLAHAVVRITGHDSGFIGSDTAITDAAGRFTIRNVAPGTYRKVVVSADGYELGVHEVTVAPGGSSESFSIRKDYAAASGGGAVTAADGPDYTDYGCGPGGAIDLSQGTGWGSTTGDDDGTPTATPIPKAVTIQLPSAIDIGTSTSSTAFAVDPTATCGDPGSSSTGEYTIEVSTNGTTWTTAVDGRGAKGFTTANRYSYVNVASSVAVKGVRYVRFTMVSPQVPDIATNCPDGAYGGCQFMDMSELEVFGNPAS